MRNQRYRSSFHRTLCYGWTAALSVCFALNSAVRLHADESEGSQFFETRIRPILIKHCYECHSKDAKEVKGSLVVDSAAGLLAGGDSGATLVPGKPEASLLLEALRYEGLEMPPDGRLPPSVINDFEAWIKMGAADPRVGDPRNVSLSSIDVEAGRDYWAFQSPRLYGPPAVADEQWPRSAIDRFVLARLEESGLLPAPDADRSTLVRRLYFDLIGLPPTPEQVDAFVKDSSSDAVDALVGRLLDSPQFGVHWGRHWLDVARYADSNGGDFNATFHNAWRYRDYVVAAMNDDKPFDQFVREQIAGDLLPFDTNEQRAQQLIATGFLMVGTKMLSERDKEKLTMDVVDEQISTVGSAFLGLTLGCCRCHDHKFDPIPTEDYYALAGIFRSTRTLEGESQQYVSTWPRRALPADRAHVAAVKSHELQAAKLQRQLADAKKQLATAQQDWEKIQSIGASTAGPSATSSEARLSPSARQSKANVDRFKANVAAIDKELKEWNKDAPPPLPKAIAVDEFKEIGDCQICIRGEHRNRGVTIPRGFIQVALTGEPAKIPAETSGRRELAEWIASPQNPLTARVIVNRVWYHLLGEGIVRSVDNFGELGERPSHPRLLDELAARFVRPIGDQGFGWSIKRLIRCIVQSRTYRMSSEHDESAWRVDPENRRLWRANRRRLPAEAIRDSMLAISQQLDLSPGGSPVLGLGTLVTTNSPDAKAYDRKETVRRSLYLPIIRNELPTTLAVFDFADPDLVVGKRAVTNVPAQALMLMNSSFVMNCAEQTAQRLSAEDVESPEQLVDQIYRVVLSRAPSASEAERAIAFLRPAGNAADTEVDPQSKRMTHFIHVLFASTEFRMLD